MNNVKHFFNQIKNNDKCNTSYPLKRKLWLNFKTSEELSFDEKTMCFYVHIPFCMSLCKFCEYVKFVKQDDETEKKYIEIVIKDINKFVENHKDIVLKGFDIGGGTPTCLSESNFSLLLSYFKKVVGLVQTSADFEPSIEGTFSTINENKIKMIVNAGIKRISFGIQTINKKILESNDRKNPTFEKMQEVFFLCKKYGIEKINLDFMYGLNNQKTKDIKDCFSVIEYFKPQQVTLYEFRPNILNAKQGASKKKLWKQYKIIYKKLTSLGYNGRFGQNTFSLSQIDLGLSSYLRNRMINNVSYKGFGFYAQSKSRQGVSYNEGKTKQIFDDCLLKERFNSQDTYILPKDELLSKYIAISGYYGQFNLDIMQNILNEDFQKKIEKELNFLLKKRFVTIKNDLVTLTKKGFKFYGAVLAMFYCDNTKKYLLKNSCQN